MDKIEKLKKRATDPEDGIYCYFGDNDFYIYPIDGRCMEVFYNKLTYYFCSFEEMIKFPFFDSRYSIADCIEDIMW